MTQTGKRLADRYHWSRSDLDWRQRCLALQVEHPPKSVQGRGSYYYSDPFGEKRQLWIEHDPGRSSPINIKQILRPGLFDDDYTQIGHPGGFRLSERGALKLYHALEAFFADRRSAPYWMDVEEVDLHA